MPSIGPHVSVRALRESHGLTIADLTTRIAELGVTVHEDHVRNIELGHKRGSARLMTAWAAALGIRPIDLRQADDLRALLLADEETQSPQS